MMVDVVELEAALRAVPGRLASIAGDNSGATTDHTDGRAPLHNGSENDEAGGRTTWKREIATAWMADIRVEIWVETGREGPYAKTKQGRRWTDYKISERDMKDGCGGRLKGERRS
jgi:hypothetical protein